MVSWRPPRAPDAVRAVEARRMAMCRGGTGESGDGRAALTALWLTLALLALPCHGQPRTIRGAGGVSASIDAASGRYTIRSDEADLTFAGTLEASAREVSIEHGQDELGSFDELRFRWRQPAALTGSIRTYATLPIALLAVTCDEPVADGSVVRFPRFTELPQNLHAFSYHDSEFSPPRFRLEENGTPWLLFDERLRAAVLSPAANFMFASMYGDGKAAIASGLNTGVTHLPAGFTHRTIMTFGVGVNTTWDSWGRALLRLQGVHRPSNDADIGLRYLGYWTDNGATYYYDYDRRLGYDGTLQALVRRYRDEAIPIRYLQLDSWWYYKTLTDPDGHPGTPKNPGLPHEEWNRYGGLLRYEAHPGVFRAGLAGFQREVGLPLIVHNRWIDPASPYHARYNISGFAALDPAWWKEIISYAAAAKTVTYEQDWLNVIYQHSPELATSLTAGEAFTGGMARAAREQHVTLQYSMSLPRHFLEGARYENLTTARVAPDRFKRDRWDAFLYTSRLASALGIWPWTDVFMSTEADNLLIATLSAGMVGIGDRLGAEDPRNLSKAVRPDGVIVKPDTPLVPCDELYVADASQADQPMIAAAHTDHGELRTSYVFSYRRTWRHPQAAFTPAQVGVAREAYVYDTRSRTAHRLPAAAVFTFRLAPHESAYFIVAPVTRSGVTLFGDAAKFVPDGRKRIPSLRDTPERLVAEVTFAHDERSVRLFGYAPRRPLITAERGRTGAPDFDTRSGRFEIEVFPDPESLTEGPGDDPVRKAIVALSE
jgi:hypothetical protein